MGRQIGIYMTASDCRAFVDVLRRGGRDVLFALCNSESPDVAATDLPDGPGHWCFWDRTDSARVTRQLTSRATAPYYRLNDFAGPLLEFSLTGRDEWDGRPAFIRGRIYLYDPLAFPELTRWYSSITRWVRGTYRPNPWRLIGGYAGPDAWKWHETTGGIFLPSFAPPFTPDWREVIAHPERRSRKHESK